jgi:CRISPR/Cas system CSM-associated protein Csm2 small subunit
MKMCKIHDELECISCEYCKNKPNDIDLKEYLLRLIDNDIEEIKGPIYLFSRLTHYTKEQEKQCYKAIFELKMAERLKEDVIDLFERVKP